MPKPTFGSGPAYVVPPSTGNLNLDEYLLMVHHHLYSLDFSGGLLNNDNIDSGSLTGMSHGNLVGAVSYQHHGANLHKDLDQGAASVDAVVSTVIVASADADVGTASAVSVTTADADATYGSEERDLINELKGDLNTLATDVNSVVTSLNDLKAKLRTANVLAT